MTEEELNEIKARAEAATPGPWQALPYQDIDNGVFVDYWDITAGVDGICVAEKIKEPDAWFMSEARQDVPALVEEVERLRAALEKFAQKDSYDTEHDEEVYWLPQDDPETTPWDYARRVLGEGGTK